MAARFGQFLALLSRSKVEFIVIGGVAMVAHGAATATFDLDICYRRTPENMQRLCSMMEPLHAKLRGVAAHLPFHFDAKTLQHGLNFTLATDAGEIDLLGEVAGIGGYEQVRSLSVESDVAGVRCQILSLDGLIVAKRAAGRQKDLAAVAELEALRELKKKAGIE